MVMGTVSVQQHSRRDALKRSLESLTRKEVYVGIPAENSSRPGDGSINNAELLYIHTHGVRRKAMRDEMDAMMDTGMTYSQAHKLYIREHGSPMLSIPPRPVLQPAIEDNKEHIGKLLAEAGNAILQGDAVEGETKLNNVGDFAAARARAWFENPQNGWPPNSPRTIRQKGSDKPLINSAEMQKSITYVVRDKP